MSTKAKHKVVILFLSMVHML